MRWLRLIAGILLISGMGCAGAYHRYADGCVDCTYRRPCPLPRVCYPDCVCHSCAARAYSLGESVEPTPRRVDLDAPLQVPEVEEPMPRVEPTEH